jgi:hypothetical protein
MNNYFYRNLIFYQIDLQVVALPSQVCIAKQKINDSLGASAANVLRAAVVKISGTDKSLD